MALGTWKDHIILMIVDLFVRIIDEGHGELNLVPVSVGNIVVVDVRSNFLMSDKEECRWCGG